MSPFDRLHPAVQHHIVNSLGWKSLRPLQEESIGPVMDGKHCLLLAPTAGGKTEAAVFPTFSSMLSGSWSGLSVIYVCPIKALLNDLHERLESYSRLVGRRCGIWHGDISSSVKKKLIKDPPDILLTTPESLEVMLVSKTTDHKGLFCGVRAVIVDEIHAFAGDDRGWHLLSVVERVAHISEHDVQRIGLSATVGNPDEILQWYAGSASGERIVVQPAASGKASDTDVQLDYVGSLDNAALVISRLHRGEKRLVFVDSRAAVEKLSSRLRELGVNTFVSHSSLSADERRRAEEAFQTASDCVIVATSTLELGIDVGDLDRVIQIDAPSTVASFLQRLGRTGRRPGTKRNCLFLATRESGLLQAAALLELFGAGYVEPILPPEQPFHIFAQQLMALALQESGIGQQNWQDWLLGMPGFNDLELADMEQVIAYMLDEDILFSDEGIMWFGEKGEAAFGHRNFMDLLSIFTSPPVFTVRHGQDDIGMVPQANFFAQKEGESLVLLLGGRCWLVVDLEWNKKLAHVIPAEQQGIAQWKGAGLMMPFTLCQAMKDVLTSDAVPDHWSTRAAAEMANQRSKHSFLAPETTQLVYADNGRSVWWTFAGKQVNTLLAVQIEREIHQEAKADNLSIEIEGIVPIDALNQAVKVIAARIAEHDFRPPIVQEAINGLKFSECLPEPVLKKQLEKRTNDLPAVEAVLRREVRGVS